MKHSILLTSLLFLTGSLAACSSGGEGDPDPNTGGTGGTSGGTGGTPAGGGGSGGTGGSSVVFCDAPATIFQVEATDTVAGCSGSSCHTAANINTFPPDLTTANPAPRLLDVLSESVYCSGETYIDKANPANSLILKVLEAGVDTSGTTECVVIEQMPFGVIREAGDPDKKAALSAEQKKCITDWVHFVAAQ